MHATLLDRPASVTPRTEHALPGALARWLGEAGLGGAPPMAREIRFDATAHEGVVKTVASFRTSADAIERMIASMPHAERPPPAARGRGVAFHRKDAAPEPGDFRADEDFPWWNPDLAHRCRRLAWHTRAIDFVEVIIDDDEHRVHMRTIAERWRSA